MNSSFAFSRVAFQDLTALKFEAEMHGTSNQNLLVLNFIGKYRDGSAGAPDANFIKAMTAACFEMWSCQGLIFDFTKLEYEWGNDLADAITFPMERKSKKFPTCLVLSKSCENA